MKKTHIPCRLCLSSNPKSKLSNIFTYKVNHSEDSLVDILFWVFSVEIDVTDPYVKVICNECLALIEYVLEVKNMFVLNQESLKKEHYTKAFQELDVETLDIIELEESRQSLEDKSICSSPNKNSCGASSPRVRVGLNALKVLCPLVIKIDRLQTSTDADMHYKINGNNQYKRRKYRHLNMDGRVLDDICNILETKKPFNNEILKKDIGVTTELNMISKAVNTDDSYISELFPPILFPAASLTVGKPLPVISPTVGIINKSTDSTDLMLQDECVIEKEDKSIHLLLTETNTTSKRADINSEMKITTNPEPYLDKLTNAASINVEPDMIKIEIFKNDLIGEHMNEILKTDSDFLKMFSPKVWLEPLEHFLRKENYTKISEFCFRKEDEQAEELESDSPPSEQICSKSNQSIITLKKQRYLEYYRNFSSFAVRELIAGKRIRDSDTNSIVKVANVRNVFVCNFCSKSFLSEAFLNIHCRSMHRSNERNVFVCNFCSKSFLSEAFLNLHCRSVHRTEATSDLRSKLKKSSNCVSVFYECEDDESQRLGKSTEASLNNTKEQINASKAIKANVTADLKRKGGSTSLVHSEKILKSDLKSPKIFKRQDDIETVKAPENASSFVWDRHNLKTYTASDTILQDP